jgi:hypothetical protein
MSFLDLGNDSELVGNLLGETVRGALRLPEKDLTPGRYLEMLFHESIWASYHSQFRQHAKAGRGQAAGMFRAFMQQNPLDLLGAATRRKFHEVEAPKERIFSATASRLDYFAQSGPKSAISAYSNQ